MFSIPDDPYVTPGPLPASLLFAPATIVSVNALIRAESPAALVLHLLGCALAVGLALSVGVTLGSAPADAVDDETLSVGIDEDASDDGVDVAFAAEVKDYEATIAYATSVAEEERARRAAVHGDRPVTSPTCARIRRELPRGLESLEASRGDGHSLYLNGRFAGGPPPARALFAWAPVTAAYLVALAALPFVAIAAVSLAEAYLAEATYVLALALPVALVVGYHAGGHDQAEIYAALSHDQKYDEWQTLSTVPFAQPGVVKSILKPALRRSNSGSNLRRSNSRDALRGRARDGAATRRRRERL